MILNSMYLQKTSRPLRPQFLPLLPLSSLTETNQPTGLTFREHMNENIKWQDAQSN
jgi:hypothetical protein